MKIILAIIFILFSASTIADTKENAALKYFEFLFYEDQLRNDQHGVLTSIPIISSFYSKYGHRMIAISASIHSTKSYYTLMSVNELNMGLLAWKQRGYGTVSKDDIKYFTSFDGKDFNFEGW
ncbi:MAG: hypothetical protein ACKE9I_06665 [Methylophagaceae bacterium]